MPFERASREAIARRIEADFELALPGADARPRRSALSVLARAEAGAVDGIYGYLDWLSRALFPDLAEAEELERWARIWGVARRGATPARGPVTIAAAPGTVVPAGTRLTAGSGEWTLDADLAFIGAGGSATGPVTATVAGTAGALAPGARLAVAGGLAASAIVAAPGIAGGLDPEADEDLRARLLERIRQPPQGGAAADYVAWAREVPGVARAWATPNAGGRGTVVVRFVMDRVDPIPTAGDVATVQAYLDDPVRRPITAEVIAAAPVARPIALTIALTPGTAAVRAAVAAELAALFARDGAPGATIYLSRLREAVSRAAGEADNAVSVPPANVVAAAHELPVLGVITWL